MANVISLVVSILALLLVLLFFVIWLFTGSNDGAQGSQGNQGFQGSAGTLDGPQGYQGNSGVQGVQGNQGNNGATSGGETPYGVGVFNVNLSNNGDAEITTLNGNNEFHFTNYIDGKNVKITVKAGKLRIGQTCTLNFNFSANSNFNIVSDDYYIAHQGKFAKLNLNVQTNPVITLTYIKDQTIDLNGNPTTGTGTAVPVVISSVGFTFLRS